MKTQQFITDIANVINNYSIENGSDTPDFVLARFVAAALGALEEAIVSRERWYGKCAAIADGKEKIAIVDVEHAMLRSLLQLPEGISIINAGCSCDTPGVVRFFVSGHLPNEFMASEGEEIKHLTSRVTKLETPVIKWEELES